MIEGDPWSTPAHYSRGRPVKPSRSEQVDADPFAADPFAPASAQRPQPDPLAAAPVEPEAFLHRSLLEPDPLPAPPEAVPARWSTPTYAGPRRHRPSTTASPRPAADETSEPAADDGTRSLLASSRVMAVASLASRVTGFLRSALLVAALGIGPVSGAYNAGNNLPNMVYELLLGGVLSSVLIPLLVHAQETDDDDGIAYTQRLLSLGTAGLAVMTALTVAAAPLIAGFFARPEERSLTTLFATLLLPEIFFYGLGAMYTAVLNIRHVYAPGAWAPVLNNLVMIATLGLFWILPGPTRLDPHTITTAQVLVLGIGTTLGIAGQALVLFPALRRSGFTWAWRFRARPAEAGRMREVGALAGWVVAYVVVSQVGVSVIQKVGLSIGGFTVFTNVDLLFQMPYGILVVSLLTAIMPRLSRAAVRGETAAVIADYSLGSRMSAVALVPVTAALMALGIPLCITLFAYGQTTVDGGRLVGSALALSAFGLLPFAVVMMQLRVFYAMRDGRTPTLINAFMVATKVALVLVSSALFAAPGGTDVDRHPPVHAVEWLNISTSASYVVGAVIGHLALRRRFGLLGFGVVLQTVVRIALPSAVAGAVAYGVARAAESVLGRGHAGALGALIGGGIAGMVVLVVLLSRVRIPEVTQMVGSVRRR